MEEWKDIKGYEGLYQVSTMGRVRSFHNYGGVKERILRLKKGKSGYLSVALSKNGTYEYVFIHRLVAQAFVPNPDGKPVVNHKNEIKTDNRVENIEWCTVLYNNNYGTRNQRAVESKKKKVMCIETGAVFDSIKSAEALTRITGIHKAAKGKQKTSGGYHWRYV